jgi:hypothetical protein
MEKRDEPPRYLEMEPMGQGFFPDAFEQEGGGPVTSKQAKDFFHEQIGDTNDKPTHLGGGGRGDEPEPEPVPGPPEAHGVHPDEAPPEGLAPGGGGPPITEPGEIPDPHAPQPVDPQPEPDAGPPPLPEPVHEPPIMLSE